MKKLSFLFRNLLAVIISLIGIVGCSTQEKAPSTESASVEALGQVNRDFAKALTAHDAVAAANVYDENASLLPPNEPIVTGRANIQKYWQGAIDAGVIDASVQTIDAKSNGNMGYEIGRFTMRFKSPKGDTIVEKGKFTEILKLDSASGKWVSTYGMWSADEAAY